MSASLVIVSAAVILSASLVILSASLVIVSAAVILSEAKDLVVVLCAKNGELGLWEAMTAPAPRAFVFWRAMMSAAE